VQRSVKLVVNVKWLIGIWQIVDSESFQSFCDFICTKVNVLFDLGDLAVHLLGVVAILLKRLKLSLDIQRWFVGKITQVVRGSVAHSHTENPLVQVSSLYFGI
jgi:hypothetical protein